MKEIIGNSIIAVGVSLLLTNFIGFYNYTSINEKTNHILDDKKNRISEEEFWGNAYIRNQESKGDYLNRLTKLVHDRIIYIDYSNTKPTFYENYILWIYATYKNGYEWKDTKKAVRLGGGLCSQHAIIFNNILEDQKITTRILHLNGHVVNEAFTDGKWQVYDSNYNVTFDASINDLEKKPLEVYKKYRSADRPELESIHWSSIYGSAIDNWHYKTSFRYSPIGYTLELVSFYLIWMLPLIFISIGSIMKRFRLIKAL